MDNIIFDLDGTLIDSSMDILEALKFSYEKNHIDYPENLINTSLIGPPIRDIIKNLTPAVKDDEIALLISEFRQTYDFCSFENTIVYEGIRELLSELKKEGKKIFIATNKPLKAVNRLLNLLDMNIFDDIVTIDSINNKPHNKAEMLNFLIEKWNLIHNITIMVGDTVDDMNAAILNGITPISVLYGYQSDKKLLKDKSVFCAETPKDLAKYLLKTPLSINN
jgi:phosphoglycolate phosphatase